MKKTQRTLVCGVKKGNTYRFFCSLISCIALSFCSRVLWAATILAVCSCKVRECFLPNSKCKRFTKSRTRTTYLSSAVFASCTSSVVQSPVATSGCDFSGASEGATVGGVVVIVAVVACGAMVLGPAADAGNIIWP